MGFSPLILRACLALKMSQNSLYRGALLIVLAEFFLVLSGMIVKQITGELPTEVIVFARNLFALVLLLPWLLRVGFGSVTTQCFGLHLFRAVVGVTAMMCLYYSWGHLPLAEAALLKQTAPFFIPLFAMWWLGERISKAVIYSILIGFIGVLLVLNPGHESLNVAVLIALTGAMLGALAKVIIRRMSSSESPQTVVFYFALISSVIACVPAIISWQTPTIEQTGWLLLMACTSTIAQLCLSKGYALAPAGQLGPYTYTSVAIAALFGWWLWDEVLSINSLLGVVFIIVAGVLTAFSRNTKST